MKEFKVPVGIQTHQDFKVNINIQLATDTTFIYLIIYLLESEVRKTLGMSYGDFPELMLDEK